MCEFFHFRHNVNLSFIFQCKCPYKDTSVDFHASWCKCSWCKCSLNKCRLLSHDANVNSYLMMQMLLFKDVNVWIKYFLNENSFDAPNQDFEKINLFFSQIIHFSWSLNNQCGTLAPKINWFILILKFLQTGDHY